MTNALLSRAVTRASERLDEHRRRVLDLAREWSHLGSGDQDWRTFVDTCGMLRRQLRAYEKASDRWMRLQLALNRRVRQARAVAA